MNEEAPQTKGARVKILFTLLARATDRDSDESINLFTNRVFIPINYENAINNPIWGQRWQDIVALELDQLQANGTWDMVRRLINVNIVISR